MRLFRKLRRKSARALIVKDGRVLVFHRKRYSRKTGDWIEYYSIPGGGIERGEKPEDAVVRELYEEMGVRIKLGDFVAHIKSPRFEHFVYTAQVESGTPTFQIDSEEGLAANDHNQFIVQWVDVNRLTHENLRYYHDYLELIQRLANDTNNDKVLKITR